MSQRNGAPVGQEEAKPILRQLLEALSHCHERHVAHCDLKSDNVMLRAEDVAGSLKLIDFGLSRQEDGKNYSCGPQFDMWSAGAIFFQMLVGEPLVFASSRLTEALIEQGIDPDGQGVCRDPGYVQLRLDAARARCSPAACELLQGLLAPEPEKRLTAEQALEQRR
jgi:calcium/calmodulin-dependent protein kinase I